MTTLSKFLESPWQESDAHDAYRNSFLHMRPAPEYATGEVILASLYRNIGFSTSGVSEGKVPAMGRGFHKSLESGRRPNNVPGVFEPAAWEETVTGTLRSPRQPNQTAKRLLQMAPIVPDATLYCLSARNSANSWNPGALVKSMVSLAKRASLGGPDLWRQLYLSLSVTPGDDVWAIALDREFKSWRDKKSAIEWSEPLPLETGKAAQFWNEDGQLTAIPANQFVVDLGHALTRKGLLTRKQWITAIESLLRIGTASHVLWQCHANATLWNTMERVLLYDEPAPDESELRRSLSTESAFWRYGQLAAPTIREHARNFAIARIALNLLLFMFESSALRTVPDNGLGNIKYIANLLQDLYEHRAAFPKSEYQDSLAGLLEEHRAVVSCKRGISSNVSEFLRHSLGQRQTNEAGLDSYDQGYFLSKRGSYASAPWVLSIGPVSALTLVDCCTQTSRAPRTVSDFANHLARYGIEVTPEEVMANDLGRTLRNLNLVLDSPDAEGGMVLVSPFQGRSAIG
ncbi:MAG: hypothetical protein GC168_14830 [Candidatus Hydrogenedens sp.]|nr:hypothetical protein [Candidatus Hydrogenedens sp.]